MTYHHASVHLPVPHLQQQRDGDCLPACAYIALAYMGKRISFWRLRWLLGTKSFGTPFSHIRHLERLGITIDVGVRGNLGSSRQSVLDK